MLLRASRRVLPALTRGYIGEPMLPCDPHGHHEHHHPHPAEGTVCFTQLKAKADLKQLLETLPTRNLKLVVDEVLLRIKKAS